MLLLEQGLEHALVGLGGSGDKVVGPQTDDELWQAVVDISGIRIPRTRSPYCIAHPERGCNAAPFDAFADAYFARHPISLWWASRGFGGKSLMLSTLAYSEEVLLGAKVNVLGGSGEQAQRILDYMQGTELDDALWFHDGAPVHLLIGGRDKGLLKQKHRLTNGGYVKALMASQRSVRGPHPHRLRVDEHDEMDLKLFDSALGQPMKSGGIETQIVASSTYHNANGTMTELLRRAAEKGWPVYKWCYRENLVSNGGWLPDDEIERKRTTTTQVMWDIEYENQEPNPEGRAIDSDAVKAMFKRSLGVYVGKPGEYIEIEAPDRGNYPERKCWNCGHPYDAGDVTTRNCTLCYVERRKQRPARYATGTDWAKKKDWTVIWTFRTDVYPVRLVAFERLARQPWPVMQRRLEKRLRRFPGASLHDAAGVGDAVGDNLEVASEGWFQWQGRPRQDLLGQYITAIEQGDIEAPFIEWTYQQHLNASVEDVYAGAQEEGKKHHLPDDIAAAALAFRAGGGAGRAMEILVPGVNVMVDDDER